MELPGRDAKMAAKIKNKTRDIVGTWISNLKEEGGLLGSRKRTGLSQITENVISAAEVSNTETDNGAARIRDAVLKRMRSIAQSGALAI